jgi:hypothetical protein
VKANAADPGRYWAGVMLDEEAGYGFTPNQLEQLNSTVANLSVNDASGITWYFEEDQPNSWDLSTYNSILASSWPAPQAYSSSLVSAINSEYSTYNVCLNLVTVDTQLAYPWDDANYVTGLVTGTPWYNSYWGSGYWYNEWYPA